MLSSARARRTVTAVAATVLGLSALAATAAPASAEVKELADGRGDTWTYDQDGPVKKSGHPEADLRNVVINHTVDEVRVRARYVDLKKVGDGGGLQVDVLTPDDTAYSGSVYGIPGEWSGQSAVFSGGEGQVCGVTHTMDYAKDVVTLTMPIGCFGDAEWVKVMVTGYWGRSSGFYLDNAHNARVNGAYTGQISRG